MAFRRALLSDVALLFTTRVLRLFAYGAISLVLVLYLSGLGLSGERIGVLLTMTLAGDTVLSLLITTAADRIGRKRMLIAGAGLMILGGAVFALTGDFILLLVAATLGVISPSGNEVGPFLAIEQAALAEIVSPKERTGVFAWYQLAGSLATAAGSLLCGWAARLLEDRGWEELASIRPIFFLYAGIGMVLGVLFVMLSPAAEAPLLSREGSASFTRRILGLHKSRGVVFRLSALFALDAFAGGFVLQSVIAFWFHVRFGADAAQLGEIFFAANVLAGFSALAAAALARRIGLVNTMVFTHVPSNMLLILVPLMPTLELAITALLLRFAISQMDVPARQSFTAAVVLPDERAAAAGITGVARTTGAALSPVLAGYFLSSVSLLSLPFIIAGVSKLAYDGLLYKAFRGLKPPEETNESTR